LTPDEAAARQASKRTRFALFDDDTYPTLVPALVKAVRAGRPQTLVILAGYPPDQIEAHKAAGVDEFIHIRANALEVLTAIAARLGVPA
jgi:methylmalonyl-CoA mutase